MEQASAEVSTSWNLNDLIAFEFLSRIVEAKTRSHRSLEWCVVHYTIVEYVLDEEKFLNCFKNKDSNSVNYDTVQFFQHCLEFDHVRDFIKEIYNPNL